MLFESIEQAQQSCREWQEILRLQHWDIVLKISRRDNMGIDNSQGSCEWGLSRHEATIRLLDPIDYPDDCFFPQDHEITVVHELLHLHFASLSEEFDGDSPEQKTMERIVDVVSKTLVSLKRGAANASEVMPMSPMGE